jgi:hypothetical protein
MMKPSPPFTNAPIPQDCQVLAESDVYWLTWVALLRGWSTGRLLVPFFSNPHEPSTSNDVDVMMKPLPPFTNALIPQDYQVTGQSDESWLTWVALLRGWSTGRC